MLIAGSSPLTRGKPRDHAEVGHEGRLIPAHAGKTHHNSFRFTLDWAHPRSRGENLVNGEGDVEPGGSSPLTRGKRAARHPRADRRGLIPAHAGKTVLGCMWRPKTQAHPRSRGENDPGSTQPERLMGSSPLTRGKRIGSRPWASYSGLIPAHAGKTPAHSYQQARCTAHPRSRGENLIIARLGEF